MPAHKLDDIDERDLAEAPRLEKDEQSKGLLIGMAVAAVLFLALLVYASLPELSPEDIISMDGYEGEQPTKYIFNIHSLGDKSDEPSAPGANAVAAVRDQAADSIDELPIAVTESLEAVTAPVVSENVVAVVAPEPTPIEALPIAETEPLPQPEAPVESIEPVADKPEVVVVPEPLPEPLPEAPPEPVAQQPIAQPEALPIAVTEPIPTPAAEPQDARTISFTTADEDQVVAARASTPQIEEASDTVVVASVAALEPVPSPVSSRASIEPDTAQGSRGQLLPLRSIRDDTTELKAAPSAESKTLLQFKRGVIVTAFERRGDWIHVGANDGSSITGFVLESSLARLAEE